MTGGPSGRGTLWQPASACDDTCRPEERRTVAPIRALLRIMGLLGVLLVGLPAAALLRGTAPRALARGILAALGIRLRLRGPVPRPGSLLVSNHISWLDAVALAAVLPVRLVAKHDVRSWGVIGWGSARIGSIFIDRSRPRALPGTVAEVAGLLRAGRSVAVFPEGTTYCGSDHGRFRPALFQAAIDANAPVVPVSIGYDSAEAAFLADETLWESIRRVARVRGLTLTVVTAPALRPDPGADRRVLARAAQSSLMGGGYHLAA